MKQPICSLTSEQPHTQETFWKWVDQQVRQLVVALAEKILLLQMEVQLQAGWNKRTATRRGHRNGYYSRCLSTPHGQLRIRVPRLREGRMDATIVFDRYQRRIADVERILRHAYLLGTSTRGLAGLAEQIFGGSISHQTISQLMRWLDEQLVRWRRQPINPVYPVVYIDGMHVDVLGQDKMVMLVIGMSKDGIKEALGFCVSTGEQCKSLLEDLRDRGLEDVQLFVSDESAPVLYALQEVYPLVSWQSCTFHRLSRLRATIGDKGYRKQMVREAACVFRCESLGAALDTAAAWRIRWERTDPWAVEQFVHGISDSLMFYELPKQWWKRARTNNPMERQIRTLRQRLRLMGCFHDESAVERAVFGQLLRWHKIKLTHNT
ncbi:MAG: IS256 family transposase [Sedimentisphaerales bacterium]|nr:IS256 family transposase [Sedimentisphaerales bacterium]